MIKNAYDQAMGALEEATRQMEPEVWRRPMGRVLSSGDGVARVAGLERVKSGELLRLEGGVRMVAQDLDPDSIGAVLLDEGSSVRAGMHVVATGVPAQTPVGSPLIGRVIDPLGKVLDGGPPLQPDAYYPVERPATPIIQRAPVGVPLQIGIKVVDAIVPIGRGQRELILGDRQTGKTSIALDAIVNQRGQGVLCIYVAIGQRTSETANVIQTLKSNGALEYSIVVVASGEDAPGLRYIAPYAGTSIGEYFMEQGRDVLIVYDDLTKHAYAYRELSLILRRPPGREAFPSDIFYAHSRLLERSTRLIDSLGGGSLTALPIAETQAQNLSAYVPTNLISITDGQVYLDSDLFQKNIRPAVDVGRSVSRVGGRSQLPAFRAIVSNLKLAYSQFEELELFSRLGTRLDDVSAKAIRRGQEIREVFKQPPLATLPVDEQLVLLVAVTSGVFTELPISKIEEAEKLIRTRFVQEMPDISDAIVKGKTLDDGTRGRIVALGRDVVASIMSSLQEGDQ